MWVSISAGRHLNNCPPRVVDASTNLCQCLLQFTFSKLIVMTMMMNISEYLLDCCCSYLSFIRFWSTAKYSPNLIVFHFAGTFSKQLSHSIQPCARWGSSGARWGKTSLKRKDLETRVSVHGSMESMPCFGSRWKMEPTLRWAMYNTHHQGIQALHKVYLKLSTRLMLTLHILLHKWYCTQRAQYRNSKCKAWPKRRQNASSSMNMSNTSNYARTGPTQQKYDCGAYFTAYALLSFDLLRHAHDIKQHCHFDLRNMLYPETQTHIPFQKVKLWNPSHPRVRLPPGFSVHGCAHWQCEHLGRLPNITHITLPRLPQSPHHTTLHCYNQTVATFWALVICSAIRSRNSREVGEPPCSRSSSRSSSSTSSQSINQQQKYWRGSFWKPPWASAASMPPPGLP